MKKITSELDDSSLLELLLEGNSNGYKDIYIKTFHIISKYVINNSGSKEDAEDLFQESLLALLNNLRKPDFQLSSSLKNYFLSITRNLWLKELKKSKNRHLENLDGMTEQWIDISDKEIEVVELENQRQEDLVKQLTLIGKECRTLLTEFYYYHKSLTEIAKLLNYTYDFIKVKKFRCMKELKEKMHS